LKVTQLFSCTVSSSIALVLVRDCRTHRYYLRTKACRAGCVVESICLCLRPTITKLNKIGGQ
jgi:hypothetical protein